MALSSVRIGTGSVPHARLSGLHCACDETLTQRIQAAASRVCSRPVPRPPIFGGIGADHIRTTGRISLISSRVVVLTRTARHFLGKDIAYRHLPPGSAAHVKLSQRPALLLAKATDRIQSFPFISRANCELPSADSFLHESLHKAGKNPSPCTCLLRQAVPMKASEGLGFLQPSQRLVQKEIG